MSEFAVLALKVQPGAKRNAVLGQHGDAIRIALTAPPVDGKANDALFGFLAEALAINRRSIALVSGATARQKLVRVEGLSRDEAIHRLLRG
ncbi:DUF167 domain-containing protein [Granulicella cerasi]|uniref:UPF0235 protein ACFQBQ_07110 n=1 Tax=Granulicella cerasi TaxID=741063 RepID=A0ABW1Z8Y7_9BACT|nr:DUF167 domain-containing protein [Granulicella cerasi]